MVVVAVTAAPVVAGLRGDEVVSLAGEEVLVVEEAVEGGS